MMKILNMIASILLILGGLNWGIIGIFGINVINLVFGASGASNVIYILVGLAALWEGFALSQCQSCKK